MNTIFKNKLGAHSGGRILDVATGNGGNIARLIDSFKDYDEAIGIDVVDTSFESAMTHFESERVSFQIMNAEALDFPDDHFDCVAISNSLHHLENVPIVLNEMKRALKPGGVFIINEMYRDNQADTQMTHVLLHHWWAAVDTVAGICHNETFTRQEMCDLISLLGLNPIDYFDLFDFKYDPKGEDVMKKLLPRCDTYPDKIKGKPEYDALAQRGQELKQRLKDIGFHGATQLIVIGRNPE